ncbi:PH domain-containing protein [Cryobacterium sp. SO2]|uniref:PH domain-containing protein n=1 Tax=Cryobacterium sp. SO2 TaxID=1897060 RepID=UPI00223E384B|nr:PH domain-containing protein [Cryobacterium sp. SO2]WEO76902.1 PH domain-containing protein [Cryobacterium sp. SO2]
MPDLGTAPEPGAVPAAEPAAVPPVGARLDLPEAGLWQRVSPKYVMVEVIGTVIFLVIVCAVAGSLWLLADQVWAAWVGGAVALVTVISLAFEPRRVRSIGYQLRADDLLFRRGIMYQRFVSVPYGRMQLVDITRGPVARLLGLADLKFVTAAASSGVAIPGLAEADADALRDRLVELAESRRAGL